MQLQGQNSSLHKHQPVIDHQSAGLFLYYTYTVIVEYRDIPTLIKKFNCYATLFKVKASICEMSFCNVLHQMQGF